MEHRCKVAAKLLANDEYITQKDKDDRLKACVYHARYGIDHRDSYDIKVQEEAIGYLDSLGYDYCIGEENGTGYYLFPDSVCVVNLLRTNPNDRYVICAPKCMLSDDYLSEHNITFLKIGRDVALKDMCYSSNDKLIKEIKAAMDAEPGHDVSFPTLKEQLIKRDFFYRKLYEAIRNAEEVPLINTHEVGDKCYTIENADSLQFENKGFERARINTPYDVVVGNVPFGDFKPYDQQYDSQFLIHDYFFIKSLDNLKPGGIAALITSKGTLDKYQSQPRVEMLKRAELIGAVRLPNNAFESAGTETVTDILFFQKRDTVLSDEEVEDMDWNKDAPWVTAGGSLRVGDVWYQGNRYYEKHSDNILGEMKEITGRFGREITVMPVGDLQEQLDAAISRMSATFSAEPTIDEMDEGEIEEISIPDGVKPFTYYIENNKLYFADNRTAKPYSGDANSEKAIKLMVEIVQRYDHIIMSQRSGCSDEVFESERIALNNTYDMFVKKYGYLSSTANQRRFADDVRSPKLFSLEIETHDENNKAVIKKADIFYERTVNQYRNPTHADSAIEAMHLSLNLNQKIDLSYMARLCGKTEDEVLEELGDLIYCDPALNYGDKYSGWVTAEEYLSGRTRDKLVLPLLRLKKIRSVSPEM